MTIEENKAVVRRFIQEVDNQGNLSVADELLHHDLTDHSLPEGIAQGREGTKQAVTVVRTGFPDYQVTVEDMIGEGDKVVTRFTAQGTHTGIFMGIPPTGERVTINGIGIVRLAKGQMVERWLQIDMLSALQQMGVLPGQGPGGKEVAATTPEEQDASAPSPAFRERH